MKLFVMLFAAAGLICAQGPNTIFQQILNKTTTVGPSVAVRNVGQTYNVVELLTTSATGHTCAASGWTGTITIEGSYDGVLYQSIGAAAQAIPGPGKGTTLISAAGAFPQVRVNYIAGGGQINNCAITANYAGTLTGTLVSSAPYTAFQDGGFAYLSGSGSTPNTYDCSTNTATHLAVYNMVLTNNTATPSTGVVKINFVGGSGMLLSQYTWGLAAYSSVVMPPSPRPYMRDGIGLPAVPGAGFFEELTVLPDAGLSVSYLLAVRCEP